MSAIIIFLPTVKVERLPEDGVTIRFSLPQRDYARLAKRAQEWHCSPSEAAAAIIADTLRPRRRR